MKHYKAGQLITISNEVYRVTRADVKLQIDGIKPPKVCMICNLRQRAPCINAYDYPRERAQDMFNMLKCYQTFPKDCYPKRLR